MGLPWACFQTPPLVLRFLVCIHIVSSICLDPCYLRSVLNGRWTIREIVHIQNWVFSDWTITEPQSWEWGIIRWNVDLYNLLIGFTWNANRVNAIGTSSNQKRIRLSGKLATTLSQRHLFFFPLYQPTQVSFLTNLLVLPSYDEVKIYLSSNSYSFWGDEFAIQSCS